MNKWLLHIAVCVAMMLSTSDIMAQDSLCVEQPKKNFLLRAASSVLHFFSPNVDTTYIEPQQYNFTVMAQAAIDVDQYRFSGEGEDDYSITFSPDDRLSIGPFFGWKWLFLGYTFDIGVVDLINGETDFNIDFYTAAVGINLLYRDMGGYKMKSAKVGNQDLTKTLRNTEFPGMSVKMKGLNFYYVLNNKRYAHQAAYNQTDRQLRSAGSWIVGGGYDRHTLDMDWKAVDDIIISSNNNAQIPEDVKMYNHIDYSTVSASVGYGYNWVFAKNWLAAAQFIGSTSYFWGDEYNQTNKNFFSRNFTLDAGLRLGIVWNNSKWFAGANAILNSYNYHNEHMRASNNFGTINIYCGYNFVKRK